MGHKVHPYGFRLGYTRSWTAKWYADKEYTTLLKEDIAIRRLLDRRLANASVSGVEIERGINHVTVAIHTAKPGIVIGRGGVLHRHALDRLGDEAGLPGGTPQVLRCGGDAHRCSYRSPADRSEVRPCPRYVRVGANSPRRWPTMFSVTYTGTCLRPL